jgi:putative molybdopterin biosynthesis protein
VAFEVTHDLQLEGRAIFLEDVPLEIARARFEEAVANAGPLAHRTEQVALENALDRVTAVPAYARLSSPHYHACAMDGIAVRSRETANARETAPLELTLGAQALVVDTGDPLPDGFDAVVPVELVDARGDGIVAIRAAVSPGAHVRPLGEDLVATEAVVGARRTLQPADLGALAAAGLTHVEVAARPRVTLVTTGSELVDPSVVAPRPGEIVDSNAVLLRACLLRYGAEIVLSVRVPDDPALFERTIRDALATSDAIVVNAGSSAGTEDHTARTFARFGPVAVHGVAIRPGHPFVAAVARRDDGVAVPLFGIPGYSVSAALCADLFVRPWLERLGLRESEEPAIFEGVLARKLVSPLGEEEYVRAVAARVGARVVVTPLRRGAGAITSLARANCLIVVGAESEGVRAGELVRARALRPRSSLERTVLAVGSHDVGLDIAAGHLAARGFELVSANVGSIAGIVAVASGGAHIAGTHAIDPATGTYNDWAVRRYAAERRLALVAFARRSQGLIVARGNPLGLMRIENLARPGLRFVNRQRDAGTRMLLDLELARANIDPAHIDGYDRLEFTHLAVAALVASGAADAGLGILAAARALGCDFVPVAWESYEFAIDTELLDDPRVATFLAILRERSLRGEIEALGGYDAAAMGTLRFVSAAT